MMRFHLFPQSLLKSAVKVKLVKFLLGHEAVMSEREIASILNISHMSVNRAMQELTELNLVNCVTAGKAHLWRVNRKSHVYGMFKRLIENMEETVDPLQALKRMVLKRLPLKSILRVVLFGSVAKGDERSDSDIDLFILVKNAENGKLVENVLEKLSIECLEAFGNRLSPYILTELQLKQKRDLGVIVAVERGIQFYPETGAKA